ncbi:MAG TPA: hypothetical protein VKU85_07490, partial [bacterium]|nr:hypothetical protein [bacterium]
MTGRGWRRALTVAGGVLALAILAVTVRDAVRELGRTDPVLHGGVAVGATALLAASFLVGIALWRQLLAHFDRPLPYRAALELWSFSNLGRYLPGKVWQVLGVL